MSGLSPATPFGQRAASLGLFATEAATRRAVAAAQAPGSNAPAAVNKWAVFRALTAAARPLGLTDRTLSVLNALLSFHPETALSLPPPSGTGDETEAAPCCDLIVFPSNRSLAARAHGMAEKTLRRHLLALVEAGLILRRDSPNGKRYARKAEAGEGFSDAFGFDLTPLVVRAGEFEALAEAEKRRRATAIRLREAISLMRRDIVKTIGLALDEALPGPWEDYRLVLMGLMTPLRRLGDATDRLEGLHAALADLNREVATSLQEAVKDTEMTGSDGLDDRHQSKTKPDALHDLEPAVKTDRGRTGGADHTETPEGTGEAPYPLAMVLEACPDVLTYASGGKVANWRGFAETVRMIRPMLGISPDAYRDAVGVLGETDALIVIATILQRSEHSSEARGTAAGVTVNGSPAIRSAGGYLRALTEKARADAFALGPVLMALIGQRLKSRRAGEV